MNLVFKIKVRSVWLLTFVLLNYIANAQIKNLLRNPSLDSVNTCDYNTAVLIPLHWDQNPFNSAIGYNSCSNSPLNFQWTPLNQEGFQFPKMGGGYGLFSSISGIFGFNNRKYLQSKLVRKLKSKRYNIYIYISLTDSSSQFGTSRIQIAFTPNKISNNICCDNIIALPLGFTPQVQNPFGNIISDTLNWTKIEGNFKANGNEEYITIGNFYSDINTDTFRINSGGGNCAYYADDMHLVEEDRAVAYFDTTLEVPLCVNLGDSVVLGDTLVRPWLQYEWKDAFGNVLCTTRNCAYYGNSVGTSYATVSITDTAADAYITKAIDTVYITTSTNCPTSLKQIIKESANVKYRIENNQVHVFNLPPNLKNASLQIRNIAGQSLFSTSLEVTSGNGSSNAISNTKPFSVISSGFEKGQNVYSIQKNLPQGFYVIELMENRKVINRGKVSADGGVG